MAKDKYLQGTNHTPVAVGLECEYDALIEWLDKHLHDLPCDWKVQDYYCGEGTSIIFYTKEKTDGKK